MYNGHNNSLLLRQHIKKLHTVSGQFNLYVSINGVADINRIRNEVGQIKQFLLRVEQEIEEIEIGDVYENTTKSDLFKK